MSGKGKQSLAARGDTALNKNRGTGYEDGFADPPTTPEEHAIERKLYDPNRPFHERIEECIQRYMSRRRINNERSNFLTKYLALGGIDTTQRQFTGTAKHVKDMEESGTYDANEMREMTANDVLARHQEGIGKFYNPDYPEHWDVDFAGVVAGFLSDWLLKVGAWSSSDITLATSTILNFLKYVRHHDVCPEYEKDLAEACKICELACEELPKARKAGSGMPGNFNTACRVLFCSTGQANDVAFEGSKRVLWEEKAFGDGTDFCGDWGSCVITDKDFDAERVFKSTITLQEPQLIERVQKMDKEPIRVVNTYEDVYKLTEIHLSDEDIVFAYKGIKGKDGKTRAVSPVGYVVLEPTIIEDGWDNHPTLAEGRGAHDPGKPLSIYLEHALMEHMVVGMKLRLVICELSLGNGVKFEFVKECRDILSSFHCFLPQTLMLDWKAPRPNDRLPPSVDDPDAEEWNVMEDLQAEEREDGDGGGQ